jgi:D-sedoheptulose 7-phosphate isomerase
MTNKRNMRKTIISHIESSIEVKQNILKSDELIAIIEKVALTIVNAYRNGRKVMFAGNGGSAADAQHLTAELVNRFGFDRPGLPALAFTTDTSILTAVANDSGFRNIFARQAEALGNEGDVFVAISTSGNSENLVAALELCRAKKITSVGLTGISGGRMEKLCDFCIRVPSRETPRIQESHILIGHIICSLVETELFGK